MILNSKIKSILKFTNLLVKKGKKSSAALILLKTLFLIKKKTKKNPINFLYSAIKTLTPGVSTRKTIVAGRLYNLPSAISSNKALYFGCNWLQKSALSSKEGSKNLSEKLFSECSKVIKKKGNAILSLKQHNKTVSENRPFLRFVKRKRSIRLSRKMFLRRRKLLFLKRRNKITKIKAKDSYNFKLNKNIELVKKNLFDTKIEKKFQSKLDKKFSKVDKKRFFFRIKNSALNGKKTRRIFKSKSKKHKRSNKKINKKNNI